VNKVVREDTEMSRCIPASATSVAKPRASLRVLLLGGTTEAAELARSLIARSDMTVISSLAGRTSQPRLPRGLVRFGGFGGASGLAAYLSDESIDVVVDATHPYAARISQNAELACRDAGISLVAFERPQWKMSVGDCWRIAADMDTAATMVDEEHHRVFLTIGRQELGAFRHCRKAWFLARTIDPPGEMPSRASLILDRGPFSLPAELQLMRDHAINLVVSKNSGGLATYSKIEAARMLGIAVVMIERPRKHNFSPSADLDEVRARLVQLAVKSSRADS
jgi:precorrin-6A/cobalt-precorrin-6A reductase